MRNISSAELLKEMHIGWNLGNSLDAVKGTGVGSETSWGNPYITRSFVEMVKAQGFDIIRIPVSWGNHFIDDSCTVDPAWMKRVREAVDYAFDGKTFVILNTHHEKWTYTSEENYPKASYTLKRVWEQICAEFEHYDEHLIFEGLNEPRLMGTDIEWNGGNAEARTVVNKLNRDFVKTVREYGGEHKNRHLMLATYCGCSNEDVMRELEVPEGDDKLIVTVHSYMPWDFCCGDGEKDLTVFEKDSKSFTEPLDSALDNVIKYCGQYPVIIGEFGCVDKDNTPERLKYIDYMLEKAGSAGMKCIWWDNGYCGVGRGNFGIFDRRRETVYCEEIVKKLVGNK
ncbi:MAG: glycoside hydrolase family 5 protein [Huintestinicola sp.]